MRVSIDLPLTSMWGTARLVRKPSSFPTSKRDIELHVAEHFSRQLLAQGVTLSSLRTEADDSEGKPDVTGEIGGCAVGIQLTEFRLSHRPNSDQVAQRQAFRVIDSVLAYGNPPSPLIVSMLSPNDSQNRIVKLDKRQVQAIAEAIACEMAKGPSHEPVLGSMRAPIRVHVPECAAGCISHIDIWWLAPGERAYSPTRGNLSVAFNFSSVTCSEPILQCLAQDIAAKKRGSCADILLVWYRDKDFWGEGETIAKLLREALGDAPLRAAFLMAFGDFAEEQHLYRVKGGLDRAG